MTPLQKKICMVGVHGTGKTSLVRRFVESVFSEKYLSTVGVKIDRKDVTVNGDPVRLLLWDLEGRDEHRDIGVSYLRGAHGLVLVADGTRRPSYDQLFELRELAVGVLGPVPAVVALNKADLTDTWVLEDADGERLRAAGLHPVTTSARTGDGVAAMFDWIAAAMVGGVA